MGKQTGDYYHTLTHPVITVPHNDGPEGFEEGGKRQEKHLRRSTRCSSSHRAGR